MLVVFLGHNDWANTSNRISRSINRYAGEMTARVITKTPHPFGYEEDIVLSRDGPDEAASLLGKADWIINSGDSNYRSFEDLLERFGVQRTSVNLGIRHGGTGYRSDPDRCNQLDRDYWRFERVFVAPDLYRFVKDDPRSRIFIHAQDSIAGDVAPIGNGVRVCHAPSNRRNKGTEDILKVMNGYRGDILFSTIENEPHVEFYRRMTTHHVLVEQCAPAIGAYGATAMEALSNGLAVVSNYSNVVREVEKWAPMPPILPIRHTDEIPGRLDELLQDREQLERLRQQSLTWAQRYLCPGFTYEYWWRCLTTDD